MSNEDPTPPAEPPPQEPATPQPAPAEESPFPRPAMEVIKESETARSTLDIPDESVTP